VNPERLQEIESIYRTTLEREPAERSAFLQERCGSDRGLYDEVLSLLEHDRAATSFLESPAIQMEARALAAAAKRNQSLEGTRLSHYRLIGKIGSGGMGDVYRAADERLGRDVAIKLCSAGFGERFGREAQLAAALNHPNICTLHDVGPDYLVMELVDGPTLAERIESGPLPERDVVQIARQLVDAMEAAHERGIVHRDLKPANIKINAAGIVKVLDFGLAKRSTGSKDSVIAARTSPTDITASGTIVGTAAYMAPEQARGLAVDKRADIWAFGCILFEMSSGKRPFAGSTVSDTIAEVLQKEPDWTIVPAAFRRLVQRCLEKDSKQRLRDIGDARWDLEHLASSDVDGIAGDWKTGGQRPPLQWGRFAVYLTIALIAAVIGGTVVWLRQAILPRPEEKAGSVRFTLLPPDGVRQTSPAPLISPDGTMIAFVGADSTGQETLWVRPLNSLTARALPGTDGAIFPFWSPDSRFLAFSANGKLKKIDVTGGGPTAICDVRLPTSGSWNADGTIILGNLAGPLMRVSAAGGFPTLVMELDSTRQEQSQRGPRFLADGYHFTYQSFGVEDAGCFLSDLDGKRRVKLLPEPGCVPAPGHILFPRINGLMARPFDPKKLEFTGDVFQLNDDLGSSPAAAASFSVSQNGTLAYRRAGGGNGGSLLWIDRNSKTSETVATGMFDSLAVAPDGQQIVVTQRRDPKQVMPAGDLWLLDSKRDAKTHFTFEDAPSFDWNPLWSPDGSSILFNRMTAMPEKKGFYIKPVNGTSGELQVFKFAKEAVPTDWSADGQFVLYDVPTAPGRRDMWLLPLKGDRVPKPLMQGKFDYSNGTLSPDGRWLAYMSNESGASQVYVQPFPASGAKWQVSTSAVGSYPRWNPNGHELFYVTNEAIMVAAVRVNGNQFESDKPQTVTKYPTTLGLIGSGRAPYAVSPDGQRLLMIALPDQSATLPIHVILNWEQAVKK
jgi:Tol biopolymer transport system component